LGSNLLKLAKDKEGQEAEALYQLAFDNFKRASEIKPELIKPYHNWGLGLMKLAKRKEGEEAEVLFQEAIEKFEKGIEYGGPTYNLSCLYAIKGNKEEALKYLEISFKNKEHKPEFVKKDEDWKDYLEDPDFLKLVG